MGNKQRGVSLVEVLIAVLVMTIGLLGMAGLQLAALRNNQSSMDRSMVVIESYSIIEAMRVDRVNAINGSYNFNFAEDPTGSTFADNQVDAWRQRLTGLLGDNAAGSVLCNGASCVVTVQWDDARGTGGAAQHQIVTQVRL